MFALTVLDTFAPPDPPAQQDSSPPASPPRIESYDLIARAETALAGAGLPGRVATMLQDALNEAEVDVLKLRTALETAFNEAMDRVSGWYKRRVQLILFVVALVVVGALNADSYRVGKTLWQNDAVRSTVVRQAENLLKGGETQACATAAKGTSLSSGQKVVNCVAAVKQLGLPLGWSKDTSPKNWEDGFGKAGGLLLTAFAIMLGAPSGSTR